MKRFVAISIVAAAVALSATSTFAQCWGGRCYSRGYTYASPYGYWTSGPCVQRTRGAVAMEGAAPCADTPNRYSEVVDACVPVESVPACGAVETTSCESCGEYAPVKTNEGLVYRSCPTGACPLTSARTAVASLLDALNATRARYGLHALTYDSTLTGGSQYQASYCASRGALIHGSGAEVLAYNNEGVETALRQWLNSPAHRALLLSPNFTRGGIAVHRTSSGRVYVAARFR
jgi:uncharacterized protein YkwD